MTGLIAGLKKLHEVKMGGKSDDPGKLKIPRKDLVYIIGNLATLTKNGLSLPIAEAIELGLPHSKLREIALKKPFVPRDYHVEAGKFDVELMTPVVLASLEVASEKEYQEAVKTR